jgi:hypothetical protein
MAQKAIGPNFANELAAAGLTGLPFSWSGDGTIVFGAAMTAAQITSVQNVYAAHNPSTPAAQQTYLKAMAAGLPITSTGTPAISGTYGCQPGDITGMLAMQTAVAAGVAPLPAYWDSKGKHGQLTAAQVTAIAEALFGYVAACDLWIEAGSSGSSALDTWLNGGATGTQPGTTIA